jgi:hypothetical protein
MRGNAVKQYDWTDSSKIIPKKGDILIGHPHPDPGHVFTNSVSSSWRKVVAITPWGGLPLTEAMIDQLFYAIDRLVLICGPYWAERVPARWRVKAITSDMAVDPIHYPLLKESYSPIGSRRLLYIGCTTRPKGTEYLEETIRLVGKGVTHIGNGSVSGSTEMGYMDLTTYEARALVAEHDFLIHTGRNDANPTTVLEAMCWGLIPICTPQSGWLPPDSLELYPHGAGIAASQIDSFMALPESDLIWRRDRNLERVRAKYTWDKFGERIMGVLR